MREYTKKNIKCQRCEAEFLGGATSKYCYECKEIVRLEHSRKQGQGKKHSLTAKQKRKDAYLIEKGL